MNTKLDDAGLLKFQRKMDEIRYMLIDEESEKYAYCMEGIDVDFDNKTVKINLNHEEKFGASDIIKPTYNKAYGYDVISIFKRKEIENKSDGNPLFYALRGYKDWKIDKKDILSLLRQFVKICRKIDKKFDTIVTIKSSNLIDIEFLHILNNIIQADNKITDIFGKLSAASIFNQVIDLQAIPDEYYEDMEAIFDDMIINNKDRFEFKKVTPIYLRKYINKAYDDEENEGYDYDCVMNELDYKDIINGKDVLVLDYVVEYGKGISLFCKNLIKLYAPKSLTVIRLFNPKQSDGKETSNDKR